jgi:hypothetical protein
MSWLQDCVWPFGEHLAPLHKVAASQKALQSVLVFVFVSDDDRSVRLGDKLALSRDGRQARRAEVAGVGRATPPIFSNGSDAADLVSV